MFYSTTGETFNRTKSTEISILPGYVIAGDNYLSIGCSYSDIYISTSLYGSRNNIHLYTYDGTVFVENSNEIRLCLNTYSKEDSFVKYGHRIAATGIATKYGAFKLEISRIVFLVNLMISLFLRKSGLCVKRVWISLRNILQIKTSDIEIKDKNTMSKKI